MKKPVCLVAKDHNVYEADGVRPFGTYDLNGDKKADAADVIQLIADHSIFPRAMAYNVDDSEDVYTPTRGA